MPRRTSRRQFLDRVAKGAAAFAALPHGGRKAGAAEAEREPDVLFIAIEDVSPQRFACWGNTVCKTPNFDGLASESLRFDQAHCMAPPCNPSRTSLLTCLRPETSKVWSNNDDWREMLPGVLTMPRHFMNRGYETVRIGKIFHGKFEDDSSWSRVVSPNEDMPPRKHERRELLGPGVPLLKRQREARRQGKPVPSGVPFLYGPSGLDDLEETDGRSAEQAIRILKRKRDKPLFLGLGFHKPHLAFTAPDKYFDMYPAEEMVLPSPPEGSCWTVPDHGDHKTFTPKMWREAIAAHYACLSFVDAQAGRVLQALQETGGAGNTIIVVWSDHGFLLGEHFMWRKGPLYDLGDRVALIMRAPGVTHAGSVCKRPVESIDIFSTLFDLCGIPIPDKCEGMSMRPLLQDPTRPWKKGALIASRDVRRSIRTERWRYTEYARGDTAELFDYENDPNEYFNLAEDRKHAAVLAELKELLHGGPDACRPPT